MTRSMFDCFAPDDDLRYCSIRMILDDETTWPAQVVAYLEEHHDLFLNWELRRRDEHHESANVVRAIAAKFDTAIYGLRPLLNGSALRGYHCTRLTDAEIQHVVSNGMQLPGRALLCERIEAIKISGLLEPDIAERLKAKNQADEKNRARMIWFCFFPPHRAGQGGIESFFRYWGGEALYNSHDRDPLTGPVLQRIGTPCLIEADVPIAILPPHASLEFHLYRQFLINRGFQSEESVDHESWAIRPIPAEAIKRIVRLPEPDFLMLTKCSSWAPLLT